MALPVRVGALRGLVKEIEASARDDRPLVVGGARELAPVLRRELARGARAGAIAHGDAPEGAVAYIHVLGGEPDAGDEAALRRARRARVPRVAVAAGPPSDASVPFVLATDVVLVGAGEGFPLEELARVLARRLGENGAPLAARVPLLREPVCAAIVASFARRNALVSALLFVPGADLPVLTLNQVRMVLRLAQAHGQDVGRERLPELLATVGAGVGLRALAREALDLVPFAGWALKGGVAYAGTRGLGEAAIRRFAAATPQPDAAAPGAR